MVGTQTPVPGLRSVSNHGVLGKPAGLSASVSSSVDWGHDPSPEPLSVFSQSQDVMGVETADSLCGAGTEEGGGVTSETGWMV